MPRLRHFVLPVLLTVVAVRAAAQEPLTVERAVEAAVAHSASLRAARAAGDEMAAQAVIARSALLPRLTVTESWQRGDQPVFVFSSLLGVAQVHGG